MQCESGDYPKQPRFKAEEGSGVQGFSDRWNASEPTDELEDFEKISSLVPLRLADLLQRGATMPPPFDILKRIDGLNFEWIEVIRDLPAAEARIHELQVRSPGEYVVFDPGTQQIVCRFNSQMPDAGGN